MASYQASLLSLLKSFLIKIAIYWFAKLVICQIDGSRLICKLIGKGYDVLLALRSWISIFCRGYAEH